jgi:splicing factor 3B subunit 3
MTTLDHHTIACGDKFGNIFVLRLPDHVNDDMLVSNSNANSNAALWDHGWLNGAPNKVEVINQYYLGEIPTAMIATKKKEGESSNVNKAEVIIVATISGGIYALSPNKSSTETHFFTQLEMFMRQEYTNLCHRDHLSFRSMYGPVKNVIDISLCERFMSMPYAKQKEFAESVDRELSTVIKKLEEIRNFETLFN